MIVRDEAETLPETLPTVIPYIDHWTVIDTGSEDDTPAVVQELLSGIPGQIEHRPWVNFAHNRTELIGLASGHSDYLLTLDADLKFFAPDLPELTADEYIGRLRGGFDQTLHLLLRSGRQWCYKGAAHSYLACDDGLPVKAVELPGLEVEEVRTNSPRVDKFERDAALLEAEMEAEPWNSRTVFYLAQTYRDMGRSEEAADMYRRRVRMGGWAEEVFWACYQEGLIRANINFEQGVPYLLEAYERRPTRAEPLFVLARGYRRMGDANLALLFAEKACSLPYPTDRLFILRWVYEGGIQEERRLALEMLGAED